MIWWHFGKTWLDKTRIDSEIKRLKWTQNEPNKIAIRTQKPKIKTATQSVWKILPKIAQRLLKNNWTRCTDWNFQTTHQFKAKIKKQQDNMECKEQHGLKKNSNRKWPRNTHLWRTYAHDTKWWPSQGALLGCWWKWCGS